jgi:hypothetical protein
MLFSIQISLKVTENTLLASDVSLKDGTKIVERAVYVRKDTSGTSSSSSSKKVDQALKELTKNLNDLDLAKALSVKEDNYVKYVLSAKGFLAEDDEDDADEFGSIDGDDQRGNVDDDEEDEDDEAANDAQQRNAGRLDTSKNRHFFVIKSAKPLRASTLTLAERYRSQVSYVSDVDSESDDDGLYSSSGEEDEETDDDHEHLDDEDEDMCDSDDDEGAGKKATSKKKSNANQEEQHVHREDTDIFYHEVIELLKSALKEKLDPSNIILGKVYLDLFRCINTFEDSSQNSSWDSKMIKFSNKKNIFELVQNGK